MHLRLLAILCGACCLLTASALKHHILTKSWDEAQSDCLEYLRIESSAASTSYLSHQYGDDQATKELMFCILLNLRVFEATQNVPRVELMRQFFTPDEGDTLHVNRTNECLRRVQIPLKENSSCGYKPYLSAIESANGLFRCFYHYYGNLNRNAVELPPTGLERQQIRQECAKIVGIPEGLLRCGSQLKDHHVYSSFSRCVMLRSGTTGMELDDNSINSLKVISE
ncbi:general odorant-binding protein 69-like [Anopheles stephensi]|uniref:general odorant-binding protein 69-like n=1 Tax=Anopheles stephensi TaxID=30069 RepID=UPI0016587F65|nr:general odorant-binding protein 69-like [Anopheles stephensi]